MTILNMYSIIFYMIKLNYKTMDVHGITIFYAKFRKNRNIRLSIEGSGKIHLTCPYGITEPEIYDFVLAKEDWIRKNLKKVESKERLAEKPKLKKREVDGLKSLIDDYVYKYSVVMGAEIFDVKIRKMKTEWGNCNYAKKILTFNTYLYYMSERFIEAIVVHELAHIFVHNHSKKFYDIVTKYLPDYRERIKEEKRVSLR